MILECLFLSPFFFFSLNGELICHCVVFTGLARNLNQKEKKQNKTTNLPQNDLWIWITDDMWSLKKLDFGH